VLVNLNVDNYKIRRISLEEMKKVSLMEMDELVSDVHGFDGGFLQWLGYYIGFGSGGPGGGGGGGGGASA
jgi:hypothetical protein